MGLVGQVVEAQNMEIALRALVPVLAPDAKAIAIQDIGVLILKKEHLVVFLIT